MEFSRELTPLISATSASVRVLPRTLDRRNGELTIRDVLGIFGRRKLTIFGILAFCISVAILLCVFSTRRYEARGEIQVQKEAVDALGLESMIGEAEGASDALDANMTVQTQAQILESDTLALRVIKDLGLEHNEDFVAKSSAIGWAFELLSPPGPSDPPDVGLDDAPGRRARILRTFERNLKIKPVSGTRLIDVSYLNPDPKVAASVVNKMIQGLIDFNFQTRYSATSQAAGWLSAQLSDLRKASEDLQTKVVQLQRESGVFTLGETDMQGREQVYTPVLDRLQQATTQLSQAQSNRIMKGALYQVMKTGDPELISGLAGNSMLGSASPGTANSLSLIQNLRAQETATQAQLDQLSAKFGPAYPKLTELQANLDGIQRAIQVEGQRIASRAKNDYEMSEEVENSARAAFATAKQEADALNNKAIEYTIMRQEADQSRSLYENLLTKLKEAGVVAGLRSSNISIVDPGRVPARPAKPKMLLYLAASLAGGLFLGCCGALLRDSMDTRVHNFEELEAHLGEIPLGILPYHKLSRSMIRNSQPGLALVGAEKGFMNGFPAMSKPGSPYVEALRALRTSILLSRTGAPPKVILVTSSVPGEGKSMLSLNLATLLSQLNQGKKVLLIDSDLRRPALHSRLNLPDNQGLSTVLTSVDLKATAAATPSSFQNIPGLDILPAGPVPARPAELLGSEQMRQALDLWRTNYDFIVIDGSPLLPVTDSVLLNNLADFTLLVVRYQVTERQSLERSMHLLREQNSGEQKTGIVLNAVERRATSYYRYYGYNDSKYYGKEKYA